MSVVWLPGNKDTHGINSKRLAEVWMDGYKRLFYMHRHDLAVRYFLSAGAVNRQHLLTLVNTWYHAVLLSVIDC